jgi:hypothetical protein
MRPLRIVEERGRRDVGGRDIYQAPPLRPADPVVYATELLPRPERARAEAHLIVCDPCRVTPAQFLRLVARDETSDEKVVLNAVERHIVQAAECLANVRPAAYTDPAVTPEVGAGSRARTRKQVFTVSTLVGVFAFGGAWLWGSWRRGAGPRGSEGGSREIIRGREG